MNREFENFNSFTPGHWNYDDKVAEFSFWIIFKLFTLFIQQHPDIL